MTAINRNKEQDRIQTSPITLYRNSSINNQEIKPSDINHTIQSYYCELASFNFRRNDEFQVTDCLALTLTRFILDTLQEKKARDEFEKNDNDGFYDLCLEKINHNKILTEIDDDELIIIYLKQCVAMMRDSKILYMSDAASVSDRNLYKCLFNSFWNSVSWENIFPSDPGAARELKINRNIFRDLVSNKQDTVSIENLVNEFIELTGISEKNDLFMISFIDFYLLTWLHHFGIIEYIRSSVYSPVLIRLTTAGRKLFSLLSSDPAL